MNKELLQKYFNGNGSEAEKVQVEAWLSSDEYDEPLAMEEPAKEDIKNSMWETIAADIEPGDATPIIPLYKKVAKYAAVACLALVVFAAGRLSVADVNANPVVPTDHLYISGGNGAKGSLPGETFKVKFDGIVWLYNDSMEPKRIQVGDSYFVLQPNQPYYLRGSAENPSLSTGTMFPNEFDESTALEGDFSILRLDNK